MVVMPVGLLCRRGVKVPEPMVVTALEPEMMPLPGEIVEVVEDECGVVDDISDGSRRRLRRHCQVAACRRRWW